MRSNKLLLLTALVFGLFVVRSTNIPGHAHSNTGSQSYIQIKTPIHGSAKQPTGDSPFIRFHHGIGENSVSISSPNELIVFLKPLNTYPEKFAGIVEYLSSLSFTLPVTREFLYSTPLRSPPSFC